MSIEPEKPVQERPKIEFPCLYPIKVIGHAVDNFKEKEWPDEIIPKVKIKTVNK